MMELLFHGFNNGVSRKSGKEAAGSFVREAA